MNVRSLLALAILVLAAACQTASPSRLETMPRHGEWVEVRSGDRTVHTWVVYPERSDRAPSIIVIHENRGLNDWARTVADRLAEVGYIALAPDYLSGAAPNGGGTSAFASEDAAREAIGRLSPAQVIADTGAVASYAKALPAANGKLSVAGFCWGGARAWDAANAIDGLEATYVFYGTGPSEAAAVQGIDAPVYGFYGGNDARVNATIPKSEELMRAAGKRFDPVIYEAAGHAFMRLGEAPDGEPANRKAFADAWARWKSLLR